MKTKDRILIVDDDPESIWPLIEYLEPQYEMIYATSAAKALTLACSAKRPDVILLDVMMPEMDGHQLLKKLKEESYTSEIPVIFLTALSEFNEEVKGLESGAQDYIIKPFSLPVVNARIKSVLNLKKELHRRHLLKAQLEDMNHQLEHQVRVKMKELNEAQETLRQYEEKYEYLFKDTSRQKNLQTVLVVDDNPENIYILAEALEQEYKIVYATSGSKALAIVGSGSQPDIILLDIMMPEMDGYEVCAQLKANAETWDIPVIFISSLDQEIDETKGLNLGAVDFITKPFSLPVVRARINAALRLKEEMDSRIVLTQKLEDLNKNLEKRVQEKTIALKKAHSSLMESEKRYRTIYETAIEGIFESTPEGQMLSASPSLARMLGYETPTELTATVRNAAEQLYHDTNDRLRFTSELESKGEIVNFETRFVTKQGDLIWVLICAKLARNEVTNEKYYHGFIINITELKESQLNNIQRLKELRLLNRIIATSVIETDTESILTTACVELATTFQLPMAITLLVDKDQKQAQVIAEYSATDKQTTSAPESNQQKTISLNDFKELETLTSTQSHILINDDRNDTGFYKVLELFNQKVQSILCTPLLIENQTAGYILLGGAKNNSFDDSNIRLVKSVADQISGVLARLTIEENRRQLEKQYFHAQKMEAIGTLSGGLAHDFNNILTVILSVSDMMKRKLAPDSSLIPGLDQILTAGKRAANLVSQLLTFSRQQLIQPVPLDINDVLEQFEQMLTRVVGSKVTLTTVFAPDLHLVKADRGQIEQVIMNLVINARDAMPQGGQLTIETENTILDTNYTSQHLDVDPGSYVMVAVTDTGTGIDPKVIPHVFEPFFTTKPKEKGTGLGLASVHGIIKQSGGHIWVYSEVDQGTSFKIYFPKYQENDPVSEDMQKIILNSEAQGGDETILLVENDEIQREVVRTTLEDLGYTLFTAECAKSAITTFSTHSNIIDLLLTDVVLPDSQNGIQLAQQLCQKDPALKVLYVSGFTNKTISDQTIPGRNIAFLQKPLQPKLLAYKVRQVLDDSS